MSSQKTKKSASDLDMDRRDPQDINIHVQVEFDDVLAEPEGAHSINCVWRCSYRCYECWKNYCYKFFTLLCGCFIAAFWGCHYAMVACCHVWCCTPCMKSYLMNMRVVRECFASTCDTCCGTACTSCGACFTRIRVQQN